MTQASTDWWNTVEGSELRQGDLLESCPIPRFRPILSQDAEPVHEIDVELRDCLVITQSCDLSNEKARLVALCPVYSVDTFTETNSGFQKPDKWESVRKGRVEGLHLLAPRTDPFDSVNCLVVDFREIYSLPIDHLRELAATAEFRCRLRSPFLEHFSQAFARFFMRVGLPSGLPPFTRK